MTENEPIKIDYVNGDGYVSSAYVTVSPDKITATGHNKHSDEPVTVRWDSDAQVWRLLPTCPNCGNDAVPRLVIDE